MKGYIAILKMRFLLLLQYRVAAFAGICTQFLFGFVRVIVFQAFYRSTTEVQPISYEQTLLYIWLGQAFLGMLPWNGDNEVMDMIKSGNVAYELCRPLHLYNQWFARAFALRTAPTLLRVIPMFFITLWMLPKEYALQLPHSLLATVAWGISMMGALLIACAITNLFNILTLFTVSGEGVIRLLPAIIITFSGMVVPLPLFPKAMQRVIEFLPFGGLVDIPARFYSGHLLPSKIFSLFPMQLFWTGVLILLGQFLLEHAMKKVVVQGG